MTLALRKTMLPHDLQYVLDGAAEAGEISSAADIAVRLYGEVAELDRIWNEDEVERDAFDEPVRRIGGVPRRRHWLVDRQARSLAVERYGASLISQLPPPRRTALVTYGMSSIIALVQRHADWLAVTRYEDATKGGCMEHFLKEWHVRRDMTPWKKLDRRLRSARRIRAYVRRQGEVHHVRSLLRIVMSIPLESFLLDEDARLAVLGDLDGQIESHRIAQRQAVENARWEADMRARGIDPDPSLPADIRVKLKPGWAKKLRGEDRQRRRSLRRGALLAVALLGAATASAFAKGEPVSLTGASELSLSVRLAGPLHAAGHGALNIVIASPEGERLANLCLFQDAPAFDQLVSLAMHMQAGEFADILDKGNLFAVTPAAIAWPDIVRRRGPDNAEIPLPPDASISAHALNQARRHRDPDSQRYELARYTYVSEFMPVYEDAIAEVVFGRAVPFFRRNFLSLANREHGAATLLADIGRGR